MPVSAKRRFLNRRLFLGGAAVTGAGFTWLASSGSWTARFFRERFSEIGRKLPAAPQLPDPKAWSDSKITAAWLGHSTVLINFYGVRILTDPAFFPCIGVNALVGTLGPKRFVACALSPRELPPIDLVLVSHAHFDHLDIPSLAAVPGKPSAVMSRGTSDLLPRRHYSSVKELRWGEGDLIKTSRGEVGVRSIEVRHWGARVRRDTWRGYGGFILERDGKKLLFAGDTANTDLFATYRGHGPFEAAIMPIGAYHPWIRSHCTPEEALAMVNAAGARKIIPVHHQTYRLSSEPMQEPIERMEQALAREPERLVLKEIGQTAVI